jgi:hypothetical protein
VLRSRYNLLTYSEQFDNAGWTKTNATVTANAAVAPDGTTTADKLVENGANSTHQSSQSVTTAAVAYTFSVYVKAAERSFVYLYHTQTTAGTVFNLSTGVTAGNSGLSAPTSATIEALANGWYRCSIVVTATAASNTFNIYPMASGAVGAYSYQGDGTSGILLWGAQLLTSADQTSTGGAYQRIAAATDYDTSNPVWRPYLAFDGTDDSFSTSSIDFSGTDEMTVFAGVTKLSDATFVPVVELTSNSDSTNGSFGLFTPFNTATADIGWQARGTTLRDAVATGVASPITSVMTGTADISAPNVVLRRNGAQADTDTGSLGTGNFANAAMFIGSRGGSSRYLNGRLYSLAVLGRTATAAEITAMEAWVNGKTGAF